MRIVQKIETEDLVKYNKYLLSINVTFKASIIILSLLAIVFGAASILYELAINEKVLPITIVLSVILILLGILSLTVLKPILNKMIERKVRKRNEKIDDIAITMDEDGFKWEYADPEKNKREIAPYKWNEIEKMVEKETHIYVHINKYIVLYIKKDYCENLEDIKEFLKAKLTYRYIEK